MENVNFINNIMVGDRMDMAIISKDGVKYNPDDVGNYLYEGDCSMMHPPCVFADFKYIDENMLDSTWGNFDFRMIKEVFDTEEFIDDLFRGLEAIMVYDEINNTFQEIDKEGFLELFDMNENYALTLVEYMPGCEEDEDDE